MHPVYAAEPNQSPSPRFGEGDFPEALNTVNWAAVFFGGLWALIHGTWRWFLLLVSVRLLLTAIFIFLGASLYANVPSTVAAVGISTSIQWVFLAVFGLRANRLAWTAAAQRIASQPAATIDSIDSFQRRQRTWLTIGLILFAVGVVRSLVGEPGLMGAMQQTAAATSVASVLLVLGGLWSYSRTPRAHEPS